MGRPSSPLLACLALCGGVYASHNPANNQFLDSYSATTLPLANTDLTYTATMYPSQTMYSVGQYVRVRLTVAGQNLATQNPPNQWLNASSDEAGIMLIKHYVRGEEARGVNYCNTTAEEDIISYTTDLSSASGGSGMFLHGSATDVVCQHATPIPTPVPIGAPAPPPDAQLVTDAMCEIDPDGQMLDAFATFEMPLYEGSFRVCFRQSMSRTNGSDGTAANATTKYYRWQEPDNHGPRSLLNVTTNPPVYWEIDGGSDVFQGDHVVMKLHVDDTSAETLTISASDIDANSDTLKLVPTGTPCIAETADSVYAGTAFASDTGVWGTESSMDDYYLAGVAAGQAALSVGISEDFMGAVSETHPQVALSGYTSTFEVSLAAQLKIKMLAYLTMAAPGGYDVCYSDKNSREVNHAWSGTVIDTRAQSPAWRKLYRNNTHAAGSVISVTARTENVGWNATANDVTAGTWGSMKIIRNDGGMLTVGAATAHDELSGSPNYTAVVGGDVVRVVPADAFNVSAGDRIPPTGCWRASAADTAGSPTGLPYSTDLLGEPSYIASWTDGPLAPTNANDGADAQSPHGYMYLRYPAAGRYVVCYRPVGGWWRQLPVTLETTAYSDPGITWNLGATGHTQASTEGIFEIGPGENGTATLTTMPWAADDASTIAVGIATTAEGCQPSQQALGTAAPTPLAFDNDVGLEYYGTDGTVSGGHTDSSAVARLYVYAVLTIPAPAVDPYMVCVKQGPLNWRAIAYQANRTNDSTTSIDNSTWASLAPTNAPAVSYTFSDRRRGSYGQLLVTATGSDDPLSTRDRYKLVRNGTRCQDGGAVADQHFQVTAGYPYCSNPTVGAAGVCGGVLNDNVLYDLGGVDHDGLSEMSWYFTIPVETWNGGVFASGVAARLCYRADGKNWLPLADGIEFTDGHGITTAVAPLLTGGKLYTVPLSAEAATSLWFDLGSERDELKVVEASQTCAHPRMQRAFTQDLVFQNGTADDNANATLAGASIMLPIVLEGRITIALCFRQSRVSTQTGRTTYNWIRLGEGTVVVSEGVTYSLATSFVSRGIAEFRFLSGPSNLRGGEGHDAFKLVNEADVCTAGAIHRGEDPLAPTTFTNTRGVVLQTRGCASGCALTTAHIAVASGAGSYRVCYYISALDVWVELGEQPDANKPVALGETPGIPSSTNGVLSAIDVPSASFAGVDIGSELFAPDGKFQGDAALIGGMVTTSEATASGLQFQLRTTPSSVAALKFVAVQQWSAGRDQSEAYQATGFTCADPGIETSKFIEIGTPSPTALSPVVELPTSTGRYMVCLWWTAVAGPTWVRYPVLQLSSTDPYQVFPVVDSTVAVVASGLEFTLVGAGLTVEDVYSAGPSLAAGGSETASDWIRVIPRTASCRDIENNRTLGGESDITPYIFPDAQSGTYLASVGLSLLNWPPTGVTSAVKVCYRKLLSATKTGTARVPCCQWVAVPEAGTGALTVQPYAPVAIEWVSPAIIAGAAINVTVGSLFDVSVRIVDANGGGVPGRHWIVFEEVGETTPASCRNAPHVDCGGRGWSADASGQCSSPTHAYAYGWYSNNTVVQTNDDGEATAAMTWRRTCARCGVRAQWHGAVSSRALAPIAPSLTFVFSAVAREGAALNIPVQTLDGYLPTASPASSWQLEEGSVRRVAVQLMSDEGPPTAAVDGQVANITLKGGYLAAVDVHLHTGELHAMGTTAYSAGKVQVANATDDDDDMTFVVSGLPLTIDGKLEFDIALHPMCSKIYQLTCPSVLEIEVHVTLVNASDPAVTVATVNATMVKVHATLLTPAVVEPVNVVAEEVYPLPPSWMAREWPSAMRHAGLRAGEPNTDISVVTAADNHYLLRNAAYSVYFDVRDAANRRIPRSVLSSADLAATSRVLLDDHSGNDDTGNITARGTSYTSAGGGYLTTSITVARGCLIAEPCSVKFQVFGLVATVTTPVRTPATRLQYVEVPVLEEWIFRSPTYLTPDSDLGPFQFIAVDDDGSPDEFLRTQVWPLLNTGDGIVSRKGLTIRASLSGFSAGRAAAKEMVGGKVTLEGLRINGPCSKADNTRIHFLTSAGLQLFETAQLEVADKSNTVLGRLRVRDREIVGGGNVQPPDLEPIEVAVQEWFYIQYDVLNEVRQNTKYINTTLALNVTSGYSANVDGGSPALKVVESTALLKVQFVQVCDACKVQVQPKVPVRGWWSEKPDAVYVSPPIKVVAATAPSKVVLREPPYLSVEGAAARRPLGEVPGGAGVGSEDVNPDQVPWYTVAKDTQFVVRFRVENAEGLPPSKGHEMEEGLAFLSVAPIGDQVLDGSGGSYLTEPLVARVTGVQLRSGEGTVAITFPRPCLRCKLSISTSLATIAPLDVMLTVRPVATRVVAGVAPSFATSIRLSYAPVTDGTNTSDPAVWTAYSFTFADVDTIDYTRGAAVSVRVAPTQGSAQQMLYCAEGCNAAAGYTVNGSVAGNTVVEQVRRRIAGELAPYVSMRLAGAIPDVVGTLNATAGSVPGGDGTTATTALAPWGTAGTLGWTGSAGASKLVVLDATAPFPEWQGYNVVTGQGYYTKRAFPPHTLSQEQIPGVAFPITLQVHGASGARVAGMSGAVTAELVGASGCGSGVPIKQYGGTMVGGNTTLWITFGSPCEACTLELTLKPCTACESLTLAARTVRLAPFHVQYNTSAVPFSHIIVDEAATVVPDVVSVGEPISVVLLAVAEREGHPYVVVDAKPEVALFNSLIPSGAGYGNADVREAAYGNGGLLRQSSTVWSSPGNAGTHRGVPTTFRNGRARVEVVFSRTCEACHIEVFVPELAVSVKVRTTSGGEKIKVRARGTRKVLAGDFPTRLMREEHFVVTQWVVNSVGDRDYDANDFWNASTIRRTNEGGNGNGGRLLHTNDVGTLEEGRANWYDGALTWRMQFSSSCGSCRVDVDGNVWNIPVYTEAAGLRVSFMSPADGVVPQQGRLQVSIFAEDAQGNRDYLLTGDATLKLSSSPTRIAPFYPTQSGDGGNITFGGADVDTFRITNGESGVVSIDFTDPAFSGYLYFYLVDNPGISSRENPAASMAAPPQATVYLAPHSLRVLQRTGDGVANAGNIAEIAVGLAATSGWVAGLATGYVNMRVTDCDAQTVEYPLGTQLTLTGGVATFQVLMSNVVDTDPGQSDGNSTGPGCSFEFEAFTESITTSDAALLTAETRLDIATPKAAVLSFESPTHYPPTHAVVGVPLKLPVAVYSLGATRVPSNVGDWVQIQKTFCSFDGGAAGGTTTAPVAEIDAAGRATLEVTITQEGVCSFELATENLGVWNRTGATGDPFQMVRLEQNVLLENKTFDIIIQKPKSIELIRAVAGTTSAVLTYPFVDTSAAVSLDLATTTPHPFTVRVLDAAGAVVLGDESTVITLELVAGPESLGLRNMNPTNVADAAASTGVPVYARSTEGVRVSQGIYVFALEFDLPTNGVQAAFNVEADFAADDLARIVVKSDMLDLVVVPQALSVEPEPPARWVIGRPLSFTVYLTDLVGNRAAPVAADAGDSVVEGREITLKPIGYSTASFFTFVQPVGGTAKTADVAVNYTLAWNRAPGAVAFEIASRRLVSYKGEITFQSVEGVVISSGGAGETLRREDALNIGVTVVDAAGNRVLGEYATLITADIDADSTSIILNITAMTRTVVDGATNFGFIFESGGANNTITFTARTESGRTFAVEYGPFTVVEGSGPPPPPRALVRYTPPKVGIQTAVDWVNFNPVDFANIVAEALAVEPMNVRPLWGCPWSDAEAQPTPESNPECVKLADAITVLVGGMVKTPAREGAVVRRGAAELQDGADSWVEFQLVLSASHGLTGSVQSADAATKEYLDDLEGMVNNPLLPRIQTLIGDYTNQTLAVADLQTPMPTPPPLTASPPRPTDVPTTSTPATPAPPRGTFAPVAIAGAGHTTPSITAALAAIVAVLCIVCGL